MFLIPHCQGPAPCRLSTCSPAARPVLWLGPHQELPRWTQALCPRRPQPTSPSSHRSPPTIYFQGCKFATHLALPLSPPKRLSWYLDKRTDKHKPSQCFLPAFYLVCKSLRPSAWHPCRSRSLPVRGFCSHFAPLPGFPLKWQTSFKVSPRLLTTPQQALPCLNQSPITVSSHLFNLLLDQTTWPLLRESVMQLTTTWSCVLSILGVHLEQGIRNMHLNLLESWLRPRLIQ